MYGQLQNCSRITTMAKKTLRVLVDMDGVLCDFEEGFLTRYRAKYPSAPSIELEDRRTFYLDEQYRSQFGPDFSVKIRSIWQEEGFFRHLQPIPGATDALNEMALNSNVDVFICTSPLTSPDLHEHYSAKEKVDWVVEHLGGEWLKKMVITKDKTIINGDILIDDKHRVTGAENEPAWDHVLFTANHNRHLDISKMDNISSRLENWEKINWTALIDQYLQKKLAVIQ